MTNICLFTAHPPKGGGGTVILHSLINHLPDLNIQWYYIAPEPVAGFEKGYLGSGFMGTNIIRDVFFTWTMLADRKNPVISQIVDKLLAISCDQYWIVSHNEGLRVALELVKVQTKTPVHLTVHDDWAGALAQRSIRYQFFAGLSKKLTHKTLDRVSSCDVISQGMKQFYGTFSSARMDICHRYLPLESITQPSFGLKADSEIKVGHIGSVYEERDLFQFLYLLKAYAEKAGKTCSMHFWGFRHKRKFPKELETIVHIHGDMVEDLAVKELQHCNLVYAMYPTSRKMRLFSRTSLPTKLTTYVQAGVPVFGHGPEDSTLSDFLKDTRIGLNWTGHNFSAGIIALEGVDNLKVSSSDFVGARNKYFGTQNLNVMKAAF